MAIEQIKDLLLISPKLATSGQPSESQILDLAGDGFQVIINLGVLDPGYCLTDEEGLARSLGLEYHHIPVDFQAPKARDLMLFFEAMENSKGKSVFVHCAANKRVSCFVALYGQAKLGWSLERADEVIRRVWEPNETWATFLELSRRTLMVES